MGFRVGSLKIDASLTALASVVLPLQLHCAKKSLDSAPAAAFNFVLSQTANGVRRGVARVVGGWWALLVTG